MELAPAAQRAVGRSPFVALERKASEQTLSSDHGSSSSLSSAMSRQSSGETGSWQLPSRRDAKAINARLMQAHSPQEIFGIVVDHLPELDSINITAALQRLAKFLSCEEHSCSSGGRGQGLKEAVLGSPVFQALAAMMVEQCNNGLFNAQSTANAWWAVAKLHAAEHPASVDMVGALENALIACLTAPSDAAKPNAQGVSSVWYSCGRLASDGYAPSAAALQLLWDRTHQLALSFDSQGIANMLWAFGQLRKKHGEAFPVRADVLASLQFVVARIAPSFAVQGLSCAAVGCANMGVALRPAVLPLMHILVAESSRRVWQFNLQAMSNMASAISRLGRELAEAEGTRALLAAFDAHAATLPQPLKAQEASALCSALKSCGVGPTRFKPPAPVSARDGAQAHYPPPPPQGAVRHPQQAGSLRDATNSGSWSTGSSANSSASGWGVAALSCAPMSHLAALAALTGLPHVPPPPPQQQYHHHNMQQQQQQPWLHQQFQQQQQQRPAPPPMALLTALVAGAAAPVTQPLVALAGPPTISGYSQLAQQLTAASRGPAPVPPAPQQLPLPVLIAPFPGSALPQQRQGHWQPTLVSPPTAGAAFGSLAAPAPSTPASSAAPQPTTSADPAHLERILAVLQSLKLQSGPSTVTA